MIITISIITISIIITIIISYYYHYYHYLYYHDRLRRLQGEGDRRPDVRADVDEQHLW